MIDSLLPKVAVIYLTPGAVTHCHLLTTGSSSICKHSHYPSPENTVRCLFVNCCHSHPSGAIGFCCSPQATRDLYIAEFVYFGSWTKKLLVSDAFCKHLILHTPYQSPLLKRDMHFFLPKDVCYVTLWLCEVASVYSAALLVVNSQQFQPSSPIVADARPGH